MKNTDKRGQASRNADEKEKSQAKMGVSGQAPKNDDGLIPKHGGFRHLKTFQIATVIYDVTVRFCEKFVNPRSRTYDQMVQAARSGRQNLGEGSDDSATSKKIEMKLTGIAKGSLGELRLDYEDFLRQRGLPQWAPEHPALMRFKARRCRNLAEFRAWVTEEVKCAALNAGNTTRTDMDEHGRTQTKEASSAASVCPCSSVSRQDLPAVLAANGALSLLNVCIYLVRRQLESQADAFERNGGFTERLYQRRKRRLT